jgi:hypothetical protein
MSDARRYGDKADIPRRQIASLTTKAEIARRNNVV